MEFGINSNNDNNRDRSGSGSDDTANNASKSLQNSAPPADDIKGDPKTSPTNSGSNQAATSDNSFSPTKPANQTKRARLLSRTRQLMFSSLTRRIVFLNLSALAVLLSGILYLNQFREGLVEAYKDGLFAQGKIIAGAIATQATVDINTITIDPDKLLELAAGETVRPGLSPLDDLTSPIDPEIVAPLLRSLIQAERARARVYDQDGVLILDTKFLYAGGKVLRYDLDSLENKDQDGGMIVKIGNFLNRLLQRRDLETYVEHPSSGIHYPEVVAALTGSPSTTVRMTQLGEQVIMVAIPIQRLRIVSGVLLLSSEGNEIDQIVTQERLAILRIFLVAAIVLIVLSVLLAGTIATPLRRLSEAANRVRRGTNSRQEIPDFSIRQDEIGTLSTSIRSMTDALYSRIEAIERFAADVSHELKNPLTSLRSAVETLPLAKNEDSKKKLHEVIQHDIKRLDRLITDISDASRLDAELAREKGEPVDFAKLVESIVSMMQDSPARQPNGKAPKITFEIESKSSRTKARKKPVSLLGHEDRLAQVIINIIDNARSFVPEDEGKIELSMNSNSSEVILHISDNGPGLPTQKAERIFERFYTDRPSSQEFGQNSGLGLSISRQIIEAHGGSLTASNKKDGKSGAVFTITLPLHKGYANRSNSADGNSGKH